MLSRASAPDPGESCKLCSPCLAVKYSIAQLLEQQAQAEQGLQVYVAGYMGVILGVQLTGIQLSLLFCPSQLWFTHS